MAPERTSLLVVLLLLAATVHHSTCQSTSGDPDDQAALAKVSAEEIARARFALLKVIDATLSRPLDQTCTICALSKNSEMCTGKTGFA
jgi:hypothetical protein